MKMFKELNEAEEQEFRQWARDNWTLGDEINQLWHPVVREEIQRMIDENKEKEWYDEEL